MPQAIGPGQSCPSRAQLVGESSPSLPAFQPSRFTFPRPQPRHLCNLFSRMGIIDLAGSGGRRAPGMLGRSRGMQAPGHATRPGPTGFPLCIDLCDYFWFARWPWPAAQAGRKMPLPRKPRLPPLSRRQRPHPPRRIPPPQRLPRPRPRLMPPQPWLCPSPRSPSSPS